MAAGIYLFAAQKISNCCKWHEFCGRPAAVLAEPAIMFRCCRLFVYFFLSPHLISEVAQSIVTKLTHMFHGGPH